MLPLPFPPPPLQYTPKYGSVVIGLVDSHVTEGINEAGLKGQRRVVSAATPPTMPSTPPTCSPFPPLPSLNNAADFLNLFSTR